MNMKPPPRFSKDPCYKVVLLGEADVGKSSIAIRFVKDKFSDTMTNTIGEPKHNLEVL